jgi:hypothetical protein
VSQLSVLASPGTAYVFSGQIEVLDLCPGLLVVDPRTHETYDIHFESQKDATLLCRHPSPAQATRAGDITVNSQSACREVPG